MPSDTEWLASCAVSSGVLRVLGQRCRYNRIGVVVFQAVLCLHAHNAQPEAKKGSASGGDQSHEEYDNVRLPKFMAMHSNRCRFQSRVP